MNHGCFISYAGEDLERATRLHAALTGAGLRAWIDTQNLSPGAEWRSAVEEAIEAADALTFLVSRSSLRSEHCRAELRHARAHGKAILLLGPRSGCA